MLLDRSIDYNPVLLHPWHYGAFVHDLFYIKNNKVEVPDEKNKRKTYDLDPQNDQYWNKYINMPYPEITEEHDKVFTEWKILYDNMGHKKQAAS